MPLYEVPIDKEIKEQVDTHRNTECLLKNMLTIKSSSILMISVSENVTSEASKAFLVVPTKLDILTLT